MKLLAGRKESLLCVGLDPDLDRLPARVRKGKDSFFVFGREIVDATADSVCAFKLQVACYSAVGAEEELARTIDFIHQNHPHIAVILDAKRGDVGVSARHYAREAFVRYGADAVTVSPYLGGDSLAPFLDYADKGVFVLCRTSNPGSGDFQALSCGEFSLAHAVAKRAADDWNGNGNVGLVVGATWADEVGAVRKIVGEMPLLIPGIGAQGGDLAAVMANGLTPAGDGLIINVSRGIIYAGDDNFAEAAGRAAQDYCRQINEYRGGD